MKENPLYSKKSIIVIGASSGIGREIARIYIERGCRVGVAARRDNALDELKTMAPDRVWTAFVDVTQHGCENDIAKLVYDMGDHVDIFFHVAGVGKKNYDLSQGVEIETSDTNATGFMRSIGWAYRHMARQGCGHIAVITSIAGTKGLGPAPAYSATKALQNTYLQALEQLAHRQKLLIRFTDIRPGFVNTPLLSSHTTDYPMLMDITTAADKAVRAVDRKKHVIVINWRWRCLTFLWHCIPRCLWRRVKL